MRYLILLVVVTAGAGIPVQVAANRRLDEAVQSPALSVTMAFVVGLGQLVASAVPSYDAQPPGPQGPPADIDPVRSGLGYRWVAGPAGTRLLRPPVRVPCAPLPL